MKVTGQQPPRPSELTSGKARESEAKPTQRREAPAENAAQVQQQTTLTTHKLREAVRNTPDVRTDKVNEVRARLKAGEQRVDPERLAQNLLNESLREDLEKP
jgi:flagellar biosynthesis anti-sigma factor FlgM